MEPRYERNLGALSEAECRTLQEKKVLVAGCGGLGGYLIEHMLRVGVGEITACDGDVFEASNLNRQLLSTTENLGLNKAEAAAQRARAINPAIQFRAVPEFITAENAGSLIAGQDLVLDALDSAECRRILAGACADLGVPLIHGAIQGWYAQIAVVPPGCDLLERLYPASAPAKQDKASLSVTPALCAALQAAEAIKLLCGRPAPLSGKLLCADLLSQDYDVLSP